MFFLVLAGYKNEVQADEFREDLLYHTHEYWRIEDAKHSTKDKQSNRKLSVS